MCPTERRARAAHERRPSGSAKLANTFIFTACLEQSRATCAPDLFLAGCRPASRGNRCIPAIGHSVWTRGVQTIGFPLWRRPVSAKPLKKRSREGVAPSKAKSTSLTQVAPRSATFEGCVWGAFQPLGETCTPTKSCPRDCRAGGAFGRMGNMCSDNQLPCLAVNLLGKTKNEKRQMAGSSGRHDPSPSRSALQRSIWRLAARRTGINIEFGQADARPQEGVWSPMSSFPTRGLSSPPCHKGMCISPARNQTTRAYMRSAPLSSGAPARVDSAVIAHCCWRATGDILMFVAQQGHSSTKSTHTHTKVLASKDASWACNFHSMVEAGMVLVLFLRNGRVCRTEGNNYMTATLCEHEPDHVVEREALDAK